MGRCRNKMFNEIIFIGSHTLNAPATSPLAPVCGNRKPLYIAIMSESDYDVLSWYKIFVLQMSDAASNNLRTAAIIKPLFDFKKLFPYDLKDFFLISQNRL